MSNYTIETNKQYNSKEIYFQSKPGESVREALKSLKFRWNSKKSCWYGFADIEQINAALNGEAAKNQKEENTKEKAVIFDLYDLTRTNNIPDNYTIYKLHDNKEIAAIIRKHLRSRFPFCKWSIKSDHLSISVKLKAAPFDIESKENAALIHYAFKFADSYNYNNSDAYSDYFDVNFYGVYESNILDRYEYTKTEYTDAAKISALFAKKTAEAKAEAEKKALEEAKKAEAEAKKTAELYAKIEKSRKKNLKIIENNHIVKDVDFFALDVIAPHLNKNDSIKEINELISNPVNNPDSFYRENCKVSKAVYFTEKIYNLFANQLLDDYSFLANMGGTSTDDFRCGSFYDYQMLSDKEKTTVEMYCSNCVAIYADSELKLIIDPQGFSYARYTFIFDEKSKISYNYKPSTGISEEEHAAAVANAQIIEDLSTEIITNNNLLDDWNTAKINLYFDLLSESINNHGVIFTRSTIQAVEIEELKKALYKFYNFYYGISEQLKRANVQPGQKLTLCYFSSFGELIEENIKIIDYSTAKYAQHDNAVKITYKPKNKKNDYYKYFYNDLLIFDGWEEIPRSVLYNIETKETEFGEIVLSKSKYLSCDKAQFDEITNYFKTLDIFPIVNTYKPEEIAKSCIINQ